MGFKFDGTGTPMSMAKLAVILERLRASSELTWRALLFVCLSLGYMLLFVKRDIVVASGTVGVDAGSGAARVVTGYADISCNWHLLFWYSVLLIVTAQMSYSVRAFFVGEGVGFYRACPHTRSAAPWESAASQQAT